jgi:hypothetical protein
MKKITVLSESSYDYKYRNIFSNIEGINVVEGRFFSLLGYMTKPDTYYHIRYIKYRGKFFTIVRILLVSLFSYVFKTKIIWTCHNIYEHNFPSKKYNDIVRSLLSCISYRIVVFHKDLSAYLPKTAQRKIIVSSFGDFTNFIKGKTEINNDFNGKFTSWKKQENIHQPDIISVSAARKNNIGLLLDGTADSDVNILIIAPKITLVKTSSNIFLYNDFVYKEIADILINSNELVGFVGHSNISVPTSIYMYASFGIPIIGIRAKPISSIICENKLGIVVDSSKEVVLALKSIRDNYSSYQENCRKFIRENSWEKASLSHKAIFNQ